MEDEEKKLMEEYRKEVEWLIEKVPRDDIYEFAQLLLISAERILFELMKQVDPRDLAALEQEDEYLRHSINNITTIHSMRESGYKGIINTSVTIMKK